MSTAMHARGLTRRGFLHAGTALAVAGATTACSRGDDVKPRPEGVPLSPYTKTTTTDEVLSGIDLAGKTVLVTGATSGLGLESMRALAAHGARVIGTVGRLDPVKNQVSLLQALAALRREQPALAGSLRLVIAGDGPLHGSLEQSAADLGVADAVWFAGARSDTPDILRALDVFVLPSLNEGISNTILEAMASGLPVIAGRTGGNPELVQDGATGALYDVGAPGELERVILAYLTNPALRTAHGEAGRARVVQNFSLTAMVQRYLDLYDELLDRTPAGGPVRA